MLLALLLAFAAPPSADFDACMAQAQAVRPRQHCRAVEIERRDALIVAALRRAGPSSREGQARWEVSVEERCLAPARATRGSLASETAQACRLEAQAERLGALRAAISQV